MLILQKRAFFKRKEAACVWVNMRKYITSQVSIIFYNTTI